MITQVLDQFSKWFLHHQSFASYVEPIMQAFKPAWRAGQFIAQVIDIELKGGGFLSLKLKPGKQWSLHRAGQHISLTVEINGRLLTRVFTLASSPQYYKSTGLVRLLIKVNSQGRFTGLLSSTLKVGTWCNISAPNGDLYLKIRKDQPHLLLQARGLPL
jgi:ferredoxin-NADP reductase